MAVSETYPLAFLNDLLVTKEAVTVTLERNDELSGSGDGRYWAAEMARPLWSATMSLSAISRSCRGRAREIDAKFRALGVNRAFLWADPTYTGPRYGADGLSATTVTIVAFSANRTALSFAGLPEDFALSAGDRFSVSWGGGRQYMAELTESVTADASGVTAPVGIYPYPPMTLTAGAVVNLTRPVIKAVIPPDGYTPFSYIKDFVAQGASLTLLQKV